MPKYLIDTDAGTCEMYRYNDVPDLSGTSMAKWMVETLAAHRGDTEYNGFVATIQKWFYGSIVQAAWCATTVSYLLTLTGRAVHEENVNRLRVALEKSGWGTMFNRDSIPERLVQGDICFWLWDGSVMQDGSSKHVNLVEHPSTGNTVFCIGGNQKNKICTLEYDRSKLYAVYRLI